MATSSLAPRRRRLQFSLRLLLLALTAFAIGFPVWYRWPYDKTELIYPNGVVTIAGNQRWGPDKSQPPAGRVVRTWQRPWGSLRLHHVRTEFEQFEMQLKVVQHHIDGNTSNHGPHLVMEKGKVKCTGQFDRTLRTGTWVHYSHGAKFTARWSQGLLDGLYEIEREDGRKSQVLFAKGRVISQDGRPVTNVLLDRLVALPIDSDLMAEQLRGVMPVDIELIETPLKDAASYLRELIGFPIYLDTRHVHNVDLPVSAQFIGIDRCSGLTLMLAPHGLACDYRYGVLWITTADDVKDWHDPIGIADIQPLPGSLLAASWNAVVPLGVEAVDQPLEAVIQSLAQRLAVETEIDTSRIAATPNTSPAFTVTANLKELPLRHMLGILLYKANCSCRLEAGKLEILPSEQP